MKRMTHIFLIEVTKELGLRHWHKDLKRHVTFKQISSDKI